MRVPELLAPASDLISGESAFEFGADAIYIGLGIYNLRANSKNILEKELSELLLLSAKKKKKVYLAINIFPDDNTINNIVKTFEYIAKNKLFPNAFIVGDPGVIEICKQFVPDIKLHLSTQFGTFNSKSAEFWIKNGVKRFILPRELNLEQITKISKSIKAETEIFIHGAMCVSISGRCLLSAYMSKRHANYGDCVQPCRLKYQIMPIKDDKENKEILTVEEEKNENGIKNIAYILNSKDLCCLPILDKIVSSGVSSLKIEGRNRSINYVATCVKIYREALDYILSGEKYKIKKEWIDELEKLDHRPYTTGFYCGEYELQDVLNKRPPAQTKIVGYVREILSNGYAVVDVKNPFGINETLNIMPARKEIMSFDAKILEIKNIEGEKLNVALTNRIVFVLTEPKLMNFDTIRVKNKVNE